MASVEIRFNNDYLEASIDNSEFRPVYICSLHKITSYIPLINKWEDKDLRGRLSGWEILPPVTDFDPDLTGKLASVSRMDAWGLQATYNDYQLYIYTSDKGDGITPSFWEPACKDRLQSKPAGEFPPPKQDDDGTIILPVPARGP